MVGGRRQVEAELRAAIGTMADQLERLQDENVRLRLERQRPVSVGATAERLRQTAADPRAFTDDGDDAWAALAEVSVLRDSLLAMCQDLSTCTAQLERQLVSLTPAPELDRRMDDRRRAPRPEPSLIDLRAHAESPADRSTTNESRPEVQP